MDQFLSGGVDAVQKRRFYNSLLAVVILLAVFLGVKALSELKQFSYIGGGVYPTNTITVNGKGEVFSIPDTGQFTFSVAETGKTVKEAQDKSTAKMNAILEALKGMGIEDKDVKTTGYNSYPKYEYQRMGVCSQSYCPPGKDVLIGYEVSQTVSVKVRKTETAGDALTKAGSLGATNISGLTFVTDDLDKVQKEARDEAIKDAKAKADTLAKTLGVKLVKIVSFYENGAYPMSYGGVAMEGKSMMGGASDMPMSAPQLPVGENEITSNVSITYEIK